MRKCSANHWESDKAYLHKKRCEYNDDIQHEVAQFMQQEVTLANAKAIVMEKFFFAGGSARFMFQYQFQDLQQELDLMMQQLDNFQWQSFALASVSSRTSSAVNSLMQQFQGNCLPVSEYVLVFFI